MNRAKRTRTSGLSLLCRVYELSYCTLFVSSGGPGAGRAGGLQASLGRRARPAVAAWGAELPVSGRRGLVRVSVAPGARRAQKTPLRDQRGGVFFWRCCHQTTTRMGPIEQRDSSTGTTPGTENALTAASISLILAARPAVTGAGEKPVMRQERNDRH